MLPTRLRADQQRLLAIIRDPETDLPRLADASGVTLRTLEHVKAGRDRLWTDTIAAIEAGLEKLGWDHKKSPAEKTIEAGEKSPKGEAA